MRYLVSLGLFFGLVGFANSGLAKTVPDSRLRVVIIRHGEKVATRIRPRFARARVDSAQAAELSAPENCWDVASDPVLSIN